MVKPSKTKGLAAKSSGGLRGKSAVLDSSSSKKGNKADIYTFEDEIDGGTKRGQRRVKNRMKAGDDSDGGSGGDSDDQYAVKPGDDDSIDDSGSEVGWGSDDEDAFGLAIAANKRKGKKTKSGNKKIKGKKGFTNSSSESDRDDSSIGSSVDGEEVEGGMLLSDLLGVSKPSAAAAGSTAKEKGSTKSSGTMRVDVQKFLEEDSQSEGDISIEYSEEDEEDEGGDHMKLMSAIDKFAKDSDVKTSQKTKKNDKQFLKESEFGLDTPKLSISTLLGALDDVKGVSVVKNQLSELDKGKKAVPKMVDKVVADRIERKVTYSETKAEMDKWQAVVVENRHAKSLDLAGDERQLASYKTLVDKFEPANDFERDINMVLIESNTSEEAAAKLEEDALKARNLTPEEIKEKMAEMSKIRALMFYEQMKRHRINKIKSKAYHRIKKRQLKNKLAREGGGAADEDGDELGDEDHDAEAEQQALDRVKERMDLRHKNTSKWAKMALQHGHANKDLRWVQFLFHVSSSPVFLNLLMQDGISRGCANGP
jgi:U3 small nucleolar RNA-associated protein 14